MSLGDFAYSREKSTIIKKYLVPKRIITYTDAKNTAWLLNDTARQAVLSGYNSCTLSDGGYILLDFGSELQGGVELTVNGVKTIGGEKGEFCEYGKVRIVFGESVSEALSIVGDENGAQNEHSTRDMIVNTSSLSTMRYGNTGFRFVKIEAVGCEVSLGVVKGVLEYKDLEYKGSFSSNDERLNRIYDVAAYTVHLNMQEYVWDGIKRDRLVWIGDLNPEIATICSVFGYDESVEKSLDLARDSYPINDEIQKKSPDGIWMPFPSYTFWWIINHRVWYMQNGRIEYLNEQKDYMYKVCESILSRIDDDGTLHFGNQYFVENSSSDTPYMEAGFRGCLVLGLLAAADIFNVYGDNSMSDRCRSAIEKVKKIIPDFAGNKQLSAIMYLSGLCDKETVNSVISNNKLEGLSTFYGYYVLEAIAKAGNIQCALDIMRGYWGAMIDVGATTFWEDFDINWAENAGRIDEIVPDDKIDIHTTYGRSCYKKLRHSLCHGWSSGPVPFIMNNILGVEVLEAGCKKIRISPKLGDLEWVKGTYPTPYGVIEIEHTIKDGILISKVSAPDGVEIVK